MSGPTVLAIETSCDETGVAVVTGGRRIAANQVATQIALHAATGGIVPEVAARQQLRWIVPTIRAAMAEADVDWGDLDAVAVTCGPGLIGSLLVGVNVAKALAVAHDLPLVAVNHIEGHIYVVHRDEGQVLGDRQRLRHVDPHQQRADQPRPAGHRHGVEVVPADLGLLHGGADGGHDPAQLLSRGDLRHDPTGRGVQGDLGRDLVRSDPAPSAHHRHAGLVAAGLDGQHRRAAHGASLPPARSRSDASVARMAGLDSSGVVITRASSPSSL